MTLSGNVVTKCTHFAITLMSGELQSFHTIAVPLRWLSDEGMTGKRVHDECKFAVLKHYFRIKHTHKG